MKKHGMIRRATVTIATGGLLLAGLLTAQSASADVVDGGSLTSGTAVTAAIAVANRQVSYTFSAVKDEHVTFSTSTSTWSGNGSARMYLYVPVNNQYVLADQWTAANGTTALYDYTPNATGIWKITVAPLNNATGSTTFTYAKDVDKGIVAPNTSTTVATTVPGQNGVTHFTGTKDVHTTIDITASNWGTGNAVGYLYAPSGVLADWVSLAGTPTFYDFTPNVTGSWKFLIDPNASATGSASVTFAPDQLKGQLDTNVAVTATIASKGQNASFGAYGIAGSDLPIKVTGANFGTGSAKLWFYAPGSTLPYDQCTPAAGTTNCVFRPNTTGAWKLVLDPQGSATGTATITRLT